MKTIFLLEDDPGVAELTQTLMKVYGVVAEVLHAKSISEALSLFLDKGCTFDAAFLDYSLPDGLGTTLMETLRKRAPQCKIIVYSSYIEVDPDVTRIIRRQAPDQMLTKPFENEAFRKVLQDVELI